MSYITYHVHTILFKVPCSWGLLCIIHFLLETHNPSLVITSKEYENRNNRVMLKRHHCSLNDVWRSPIYTNRWRSDDRPLNVEIGNICEALQRLDMSSILSCCYAELAKYEKTWLCRSMFDRCKPNTFPKSFRSAYYTIIRNTAKLPSSFRV